MKFVSDPFGVMREYRDGAHTGIDIPLVDGTTLRSVVDGTVYAIRDYGAKNIGKGVIIQGEDGNYYIYGHMSEITVEKGMEVNAGAVIGESGNTGHVVGENGGYHLHFGIQEPDGTFIDPTHMQERLMGITGDKTPLEVVNAINTTDDTGFGAWALEQYNEFSDWVIGKEVEFILKPLASLLKDITITLWDWFILNLPNIMGYTTVLMGVLIILGAMVGRDGMIKIISVYSALMILALCLLGGV